MSRARAGTRGLPALATGALLRRRKSASAIRNSASVSRPSQPVAGRFCSTRAAMGRARSSCRSRTTASRQVAGDAAIDAPSFERSARALSRSPISTSAKKRARQFAGVGAALTSSLRSAAGSSGILHCLRHGERLAAQEGVARLRFPRCSKRFAGQGKISRGDVALCEQRGGAADLPPASRFPTSRSARAGNQGDSPFVRNAAQPGANPQRPALSLARDPGWRTPRQAVHSRDATPPTPGLPTRHCLVPQSARTPFQTPPLLPVAVPDGGE